MKYFTKYLPVEDEINKGDTVLDILDNQYDIWLDEDKFDEHGRFKKVKLFLCSRDIQIGDRFNSANGTGFVANKIDSIKIYSIGGLSSDIEEVPHSKEYSFKVIGEISSAAIWVKEGDEFEQEELALLIPDGGENDAKWYLEMKHEDHPHYRTYFEWQLKTKVYSISVKCPTCKTFH